MSAKKFISTDGDQYSTVHVKSNKTEDERACYYELPIHTVHVVHAQDKPDCNTHLCVSERPSYHKCIKSYKVQQINADYTLFYVLLRNSEWGGGGRGIKPVKITPNTFNLINFYDDK
jgi:hypothetical protein